MGLLHESRDHAVDPVPEVESLTAVDSKTPSATRALVNLGRSLWKRPFSLTGIWRTLRVRQKSFRAGSLITIAFSLLTIIVGGAISIMGARGLGPNEFGQLCWFVTGTSFVAMFADIAGIRFAVPYLVAGGQHTFRPAQITSTVGAYAICVGASCGLLLAFIPQLRDWLFPGFYLPKWNWLIVAAVLGLVIVNQLRYVFVGERDFIVLGALDLLRPLSYGIVMALLLYGFRLRRAVDVGWAHVIASWLGVVVAAAIMLRRGLAVPSWDLFRTCTKTGSRAALANILSFLHMRIDQYLIKVFLGPAVLGHYAVAVSLGELLTSIPRMIGTVLFPIVASTNDHVQAARNTMRYARRIAAIGCVVSVVCLVFARGIIQLAFGNAYDESVRAFQCLLPGMLFLSALILTNNHLSGVGYPLSMLMALAAGLVVNLALNCWWLPRWGVAGASLASSVSYGLQLWISWYAVRRLVHHVQPNQQGQSRGSE